MSITKSFVQSYHKKKLSDMTSNSAPADIFPTPPTYQETFRVYRRRIRFKKPLRLMVIQAQRFSCTHPLRDFYDTPSISKKKSPKKPSKNIHPDLLSDAESEHRPENADPELGLALYGTAEEYASYISGRFIYPNHRNNLNLDVSFSNR